MNYTNLRAALFGVAMLALAGCATTGGGGSSGGGSSGGGAGGSSGGSSGGGSGGVSGGVSLPGLPGIPGGGLPGSGLPGTGLPGAGLPDAGSGGVGTGGAGSAGGAAPTGSGEGSGASGTAGDAAGSATTAEERRAVLDRELDKSLGEFDETLRGEQDRVAQERDSRAATAAGSADVDSSAGAREARAGDLKSDAAAREAATAKQASESKGDTNVGGGSGAPNRGIPSGEDDDIVARRLRRAAEQETDPELKEKLWKEYVDYKRGAQGKS